MGVSAGVEVRVEAGMGVFGGAQYLGQRRLCTEVLEIAPRGRVFLLLHRNCLDGGN